MFYSLFNSQVKKFNPYHDEGGMFTEQENAKFISTGDKFAKFLTRAKGMHTGPNHGAGYSGKVAAGLNKVLGNRPNPDHRRVADMKSHTVDATANTREKFKENKDNIHSVLTMNGFKHKGTEYLHRGTVQSDMYDHPNGAAARVEHDVQSDPKASKWIGTDIYHGKAAPRKPVKKGWFNLFSHEADT